ncbi:MAG: hypothetical protein LUC97_00140 [Clostridiales bacterium]|nr:hypothetical protein [Clostridiales bacterium]
MYTSDINFKKTGLVYLVISAFCMLFGAVYEHFSHEVYSNYMIYAFAIPLIGGTLPACGASLLGKSPKISRAAFNLWNSAAATLTVGCIIKGILEIYGTTNRLTTVYWVIGAILTVSALITGFSDIKSRKA